MALGSRIRYDTGVMSVRIGSKRIKLQLHPRTALQEELEEKGSLDTDSDSDSESEPSDAENREESIGLFYAAQKQEIISPEENYSNEGKNGLPQEITDLIKEFPEIFPNSIEELGEIKDSKFQIDVPDNESPPRCGMRRDN
ncbi:hypothetical protein AYI69_g11448 [Smittium culicis]|uniref:Uncharacterized protein n=1 Tax=Smittium culicis TaxID=133412 RepID=A0A1R1WYL7_9FUNG|nr:hypothetical protein AYI69_g11448 [Smittium culicis]